MAHEKLLALIDRFLADTNMSATYFGEKAAGNSKLVKRLREGRPILTDTDLKVRAFIESEIRIRRREAMAFLKRSGGGPSQGTAA